MKIDTAMDKTEAGQIVRDLLRSDYFQSFNKYDRVYDPEGLYEVEAEIEGSDGEAFYWQDDEREAFRVFAQMSPADRACALDIELDSAGNIID